MSLNPRTGYGQVCLFAVLFQCVVVWYFLAVLSIVLSCEFVLNPIRCVQHITLSFSIIPSSLCGFFFFSRLCFLLAKCSTPSSQQRNVRVLSLCLKQCFTAASCFVPHGVATPLSVSHNETHSTFKDAVPLISMHIFRVPCVSASSSFLAYPISPL